MSIAADFFVADHDDALAYEELTLGHPDKKDSYAPAVYYRVHSLHIGFLYALLEGEPWDVKKHMLVDHYVGETWLEQFKDELVSLLAGIDEGSIERIATMWMECDEPPYGNLEDTRDLLTDLRRLAIDAKSRQKGMYLWGCI